MVDTKLAPPVVGTGPGKPEGTATVTQRDLANLKEGDPVKVRTWCYRGNAVIDCTHDATFVGWSALGHHPIVRKDDGLLHTLLSANQLV